MKLAIGMVENRRTIAHDFIPTVPINRTYGRQLTGTLAQTIARINQEGQASFPNSPTESPNSPLEAPHNIPTTKKAAQSSQQSAKQAEEADDSYEADDDINIMGNDTDSSEICLMTRALCAILFPTLHHILAKNSKHTSEVQS